MQLQKGRSGSPEKFWVFVSAAGFSLVIVCCWIVLLLSSFQFSRRVQSVIAILIGALVMVSVSVLVLHVETRRLEQGWKERTLTRALNSNARAASAWTSLVAKIPDPFDIIFGPILEARFSKRLSEELASSGLSLKPSRYLLGLLLATAAGATVGHRIGGWPLLVMFMIIAHLPLRMLVRRLARARQTNLSQQVPVALDSIASGLAAGLSIQQALALAADEVPRPLGQYLTLAQRRTRYGQSISRVLGTLADETADEGMRLALDGLQLTHQVGGNAVEMLEETADLVRDRVDLELEVQSTLSQGRLSAWVVGGLAPVSAAFLLATNPRYIDVLFETLTGQVLLATAIMLQLIGWLAISRLTAFEV